MSVRKRSWKTAKGEEKTAWVVDYFDVKGARRHKSFAKKKEADAFSAVAKVEVQDGTHVADRASATVKKAADFWLATVEAAGRERTTLDSYRSHVNLHISPFIGDLRLNALNIPTVRAFEDDLRKGGRSPALTRKILVSLGSLLADAQERGLTSQNVVRDMRGRRKGGEKRQEKRRKGRLKVGVDIPTRDEVRALVGALSERWRPLLLTAIFSGLRASELRGLRWSDVDQKRREIRVHQRADRFGDIGAPKSETSERTVPVPPMVLNALKEWKLACPKGEADLVFPNGSGKVEQLNNIVRRGLQPSLVSAGVTIDTGDLDEDRNPVVVAKYTGMHALRHFYASWCINRKEDGGLGLPPKVVQERMGHSTITMTMDVYGHLFPRGDDAEEMAAAERSLLG
ncbi:MAG TPA: tyrosine-type recombinase/integrase [Tianweitania sediminis]|jgi:integrase|nr:tyrosine-type recombinase/integrase [Tianweitania sediminis]